MQFEEPTAAQSVVGLGPRDKPVGSIDAVGVVVAVGVGVFVEWSVGKGVMLLVSGDFVQVGGRTIFVPVGGEVLLG